MKCRPTVSPSPTSSSQAYNSILFTITNQTASLRAPKPPRTSEVFRLRPSDCLHSASRLRDGIRTCSFKRDVTIFSLSLDVEIGRHVLKSVDGLDIGGQELLQFLSVLTNCMAARDISMTFTSPLTPPSWACASISKDVTLIFQSPSICQPSQ
jgi:hypothetical protein